MPSRRSLLASVAVTAIGGCLESTPGSGGGAGGETPTASRTPTPDPAADEPDVHRGRDEVDLDVVERYDDDEDYSYFPDNETVRYPRILHGDGEVKEYGSLSFGEFTEIGCPGPAIEPARGHVAAELEEDAAYRSGVGRVGSLGGIYPRFTYYTKPREDSHREGDRPTTEVPLEEFVDVVPRTVSVTLVFEEREHDCEVPVYVVEE